VIIVILFASQRIGSAKVGSLFGPVMIVWFVAIGACGVVGIAGDPQILKALLPTYAVGFLVGHFSIAFFSLAAVVLAITGAEALYADMGHFGRPPITRAWLGLVFPACILSYLGQGALVLEDPTGAIGSPFFLLVPQWGRLPMVLLACASSGENRSGWCCWAAARSWPSRYLFLAANVTKILYGAWVPLLIAVTVFTVLTTWQRGRAVVTERREHDEGSLRAFVDELHTRRPPLRRVPGTAVFLNRGKATAPLAMRANVEHNHILHEHVLILAIETSPVPHVPPADRVVVDDLGYTDDGISHVTAHFGYMEGPNVPAVLRLADAAGLEGPLDLDDASYFCPPSSCASAGSPA
jgi:K+ transporter